MPLQRSTHPTVVASSTMALAVSWKSTSVAEVGMGSTLSLSCVSTGGNGLELQVRVLESKSWRVHSMGPRMFLRTAMT
jgi:hypothetical protein